MAAVGLPLSPPLAPQLARVAKELPRGAEWVYERKWDGFRALAFVEGERAAIQSRNGKTLERYFPELSFPAGRYVIDGEIVIRDASGREDFDALSGRIHPAASRIERLARETPACFVAFDLLADADQALIERPFHERRARLEALVAEPLELGPCSADPVAAEDWLRNTEGVIAKLRDEPYRPGKRAGMVKVKRVRTIDCVLVGYRPGKEPQTVGSLILGLYDEASELRVVGHSSGFSAAQKRDLVGQLAPYESGERGSAAPSRWTGERNLEWVALRPELVAEVSFDHVSGQRIRHGAKLQRFRDDKPPADCDIEQLAS